MGNRCAHSNSSHHLDRNAAMPSLSRWFSDARNVPPIRAIVLEADEFDSPAEIEHVGKYIWRATADDVPRPATAPHHEGVSTYATVEEAHDLGAIDGVTT